MPFPDSPRVLFTRNPLDQVICQLKFPTILSISANEPDKFQEIIRNDYPVFAREVTEGLPKDIAAILRQVGGVTGINESVEYKFSSDGDSRIATLNKEFIALAELNYHKWDDFYTELEKIRTALEQIYRPSFYTRIGLRYVDVIDKQKLGIEELPWSELLIPEFIGTLKDENIGTSIKLMREDLHIDLSNDIQDANVRVRHGLLKNDNPNVYVISVFVNIVVARAYAALFNSGCSFSGFNQTFSGNSQFLISPRHRFG